MAEKGKKPNGNMKNEIVVFSVVKDTVCTECGEELWKGRLLRLENDKALCMACADLDRLEFLPSGDAAVTRRASRYSTLQAVVVRWSRARKRYERQGILAEPQAIRRAEEESLADEEVRAIRQARAAERRSIEDQEFVAAFARAIRLDYPGCPEAETTQIAEHACEKYSGRVGRTAAAKEFSPEAIRLAVAAHIRHVQTDYDVLISIYVDFTIAREEIRDQVLAMLDNWQRPSD
jgi:RNase P subunit RPR2